MSPTPRFSPPPSHDPRSAGLLLRLAEPPRKIAVLKASRIGDLINTTPALRALKQAYPQSELALISLPMLKAMIDRLPYVDRFIPFPGYPGLAEQFFEPARAAAFFQAMQAEAFDLAVQIQGSGVYANPFMLMLGARITAGFVREGDPPGLLAAALPWPTHGHEAHRNLALVRFLGLPAQDARPDFPLWPEDRDAAQDWLKTVPRPWIGIHTTARDQTRRWPLAKFIQAAAQVQRRHGGAVILLGERAEQTELEATAQAAGFPYLNLAGCTTLPVSGAVIERLAVFLSNDTGPAHIAYALGAPTVTIFGGGDPERNGPAWEGPFRVLAHPVPCRPCETGTCPIQYHCLEQISVEQVVEAAEEVFQNDRNE